MTLCSIPAPNRAESANGHSRPILVVKYLGQIESYATFRQNNYEFNISQEICEALEAGNIVALYQVEDDEPIGIVLKDVHKAEDAG